ncbi:hypothetical protein GRJ2_003411400 [Grus japonensis]|uniref:Uncharacterized protein n=1 Tax=Grus japonensis TaxID=30415 RepID=A0ABC9YKU1_GRUJA
MVRQVVFLQPMEVHGGTDIHPLARGGPHAQAGGYALKEAMTLWRAHDGAGSWQELQPVERAHAGASFLAGPVTLWGNPHWTSLFLKDCTLWKGPMLEQFVKNCSLWEGPTLEKFMKDCLPWEGPHAGAGEEREGGRSARDEAL